MFSARGEPISATTSTSYNNTAYKTTMPTQSKCFYAVPQGQSGQPAVIQQPSRLSIGKPNGSSFVAGAPLAGSASTSA